MKNKSRKLPEDMIMRSGENDRSKGNKRVVTAFLNNTLPPSPS